MAQHLPYPVLLRSQGASFVVLGFLGRLPIAVLPLALLLFVHDRLGSFALAGSATAALSLGGACGAVLVGHLSDRLGHRVVAIGATTLQTLALVGFMLACRPETPLGFVLVLAALTGFANPQLGAQARARWSQAAARRSDREAYTASAMAWEGAVEEVSFVLGPVIATTLSVVAAPVPLIVALALAWIGQVGFALHHTALPPAHHGRHRHAASPDRIDLAMLFWLGLSVGGVGVLFGGSQTSVAAFFTLRGETALTGLVYGAMAVGSTAMGLLSARLPARFGLGPRIAVFGLGAALVAPLLTIATDAAGLAAACLLIGLLVGPVLVAAFAAAERIAPPERMSTVMTVLSTCIVVGIAAGAALAGFLVDSHSPHTAAWIATAGALLAGLAGLLTRRSDRAASRSGPRRASEPERSGDVV